MRSTCKNPQNPSKPSTKPYPLNQYRLHPVNNGKLLLITKRGDNDITARDKGQARYVSEDSKVRVRLGEADKAYTVAAAAGGDVDTVPLKFILLLLVDKTLKVLRRTAVGKDNGTLHSNVFVCAVLVKDGPG